MQLARFETTDGKGFGPIAEGTVRDVSGTIATFRDLLQRVTTGEGLPSDGSTYEKFSYRPPTTPQNTVFNVALNYRAHADESDEGIPERPLVFLKLYRSLTGHRQPIRYHTFATDELDYEAELGAVIGRPAWRVDRSEALEYVAGYTILNDTSARDIQFMQVGEETEVDWFSGKAMQETSPLGPHIATTEAVGDPSELHIQSRVNGELLQDEDTDLMIRDVPDLVEYLSHRVRLEPGDVIATGTPEGVGTFQDIALEDGDRVEMTIDGIGTLSNTVRAEE